MKRSLSKLFLRAALLATAALTAAACVEEPAYGPGYSGGYYYDEPVPVYGGGWDHREYREHHDFRGADHDRDHDHDRGEHHDDWH